MQTPWAIADRLGDYVLAKNYYGRPVLFENETDLHVKPSRLLFNSAYQDGPRTAAKGFKAKCHVLQRYVESQRLSRKKHATENITSLSWETVWSRVSSLPRVMGGARVYADIAWRYLDNPLLSPVSNLGVVQESELFEGITLQQLGRRLAQVINTYLLVGQVYGTATEADSNFEYNITAPVEVGNFVEVYTVDWTWMALFVVPWVILLASGIASIVFAYLVIGPEILGYAFSIVRDSKYVNLPAEAGKKEAFKVVKIMGQKRLKYSYIDSVAEDSQSLVGVGLKNETNSIKILTYNSGSTKTTK
ncbi:hypothetical protein EDB82DRAFT_553009 [Fusarium venenatum]|uniref:uncharacterized protein n=1 Tax=Fusarium venenatum TaxID=56646 RepID=UPI001D2671CE|nr:hypothetical protein EDB82DRAFT_553009 [Fusarium venenatum]